MADYQEEDLFDDLYVACCAKRRAFTRNFESLTDTDLATTMSLHRRRLRQQHHQRPSQK